MFWNQQVRSAFSHCYVGQLFGRVQGNGKSANQLRLAVRTNTGLESAERLASLIDGDQSIGDFTN